MYQTSTNTADLPCMFTLSRSMCEIIRLQIIWVVKTIKKTKCSVLYIFLSPSRFQRTFDYSPHTPWQSIGQVHFENLKCLILEITDLFHSLIFAQKYVRNLFSNIYLISVEITTLSLCISQVSPMVTLQFTS